MSLPLPYQLKRFLRLCDAQFSRRTEQVQLGDRQFRFYETYWWPNASQPVFEQEIGPYLDVLKTQTLDPTMILDVGAATGHFAIPMVRMFPGARVVAFEPSLRQRILFGRNAALNNVTSIEVEPFGLWSCSDVLAFRTNGAESSFASVSRFAGTLPFPEHVPVKALDEWVAEQEITALDLLKADVEGAELAMLEGGRRTLERLRPQLLIQAYHIVNGTRTFERCAELLVKLGYRVNEPHAGLLHGV